MAKFAHAACMGVKHGGAKAGSDISAYIASRGPALEAPLQKRHDFVGPSGTEAWLMGLREAELRELVAMAEWAVEHARKGGWITAEDVAVEIDGTPGEDRWLWGRARLAVDPDRSYRVLGGVLDMRATLKLPFDRVGVMLARRESGAQAGAAADADASAGVQAESDDDVDDDVDEDVDAGETAELPAEVLTRHGAHDAAEEAAERRPVSDWVASLEAVAAAEDAATGVANGGTAARRREGA